MERRVDRLLQYLSAKGITENKATVDCELSKGLICQAKSGKADIGNKAVDKILATYTDLNRVWFLTGEGSMLNTEQPKLVAEQIPSLSNVEILLRDMLAEERAKNDTLQELIWELKEENGRLKEQLRAKGGDVRNAVDSSSAVA